LLIYSNMHRVFWTKDTLRAVSALRCIPRVSHICDFRRNLAFLSSEDDYLPNLLAKHGLLKFLQPLKEAAKVESSIQSHNDITSAEHFLLRFTIDRSDICIKCHVVNKPEDKSSKRFGWSINYPPYRESIKPPAIPRSVVDSPNTARLKELADVLWRAFCMNDFLALDVEANLHPDGSMSFPKCSAQVDESATYRQGDIFEHVIRQEHPDEIEAEKSSLVYRRFVASVLY
jgi:hypothetical protein